MAAPTNDPILNLDIIDEVPTVQIQGQRYGLYPAEALSIGEMLRFHRLAPRLHDLSMLDERTPAQEAELADVLNRLCRVILKAPDEVHARLLDAQRMMIYGAFVTLPNASLPAFVSQTAQAALASSPGTKRSRGSRGSMAEDPTSGSGRSRRAGSART